MTLSLKPQHLKRYRDIAWLLMKYGRSDLVRSAGLEQVLDERARVDSATQADPVPEQEKAAQFAADLENLGPTYIKLGQLLSTRPDLLSPAFLDALTRLQDRVEPFSFAEVESIIESELGVRMSKAFADFDATPLAAASIGQVHRASLRDGRAVAVKVQRPHIQETVLADLEALGEIAEFIDAHTEVGRKLGLRDMVEEFRKSLLRELDYRLEARNIATLAKNLAEFDRIVVPAAIEDYSSSRVLTTELVNGLKITALNPVVQTDLDGDVLVDQLFQAYLKQFLIDGFYHADPHPGNVFLTHDDRIALFDLGMVGRVTPSMQENLLKVLLAISEGRSDEAARAAMQIGKRMEDFDEPRFKREVADVVGIAQQMRPEDIQVGRTVLALSRIGMQCGIRIPPEVTMLGKTLLNLDQIARTLDPRFDPNAAVRRHATSMTQRKLLQSVSPGHILETVLEAKTFLEKLPGRVNRLFDMVSNNEIKVRVEAFDERLIMEGFQKVANRIAMGLVLAALIVGASTLMRVETSFRILGYPGLAMLCFLAASAGGVLLILNISLSDIVARKRKGVHRSGPT